TGLSTLALLVLLVTGMNASALQTGLAMTRGREIAMRLSLGASRGRVLRQLLTESGLLGLVAGSLALALLAAIHQLGAAILANFPFPLTIGASSIAFTFGIALAAGVLAGLSPALHAARAGVAATLKASMGGSAKRGGLQRGLVVAQLLLTQPLVVMLTAMVLIIVTEYRRESAQDASSAVATIELRSSDATTGSLDPTREIERLAAHLETVPAVVRAIPDANRTEHFDSYVAARPATAVAAPIDIEAAVVAPGWFETMDRAIRAGRAFDAADARPGDARGDRPVVIGEDLAAALWPGRSPLGERLVPPADSEEPALVVVGVAETPPGTERRPGSEYEVFVPPSAPPSGIALLVRLRGDPATALREVRAALREAAPGLGILELRTLAQLAQESKRELLVGTGALAGLGVLALLISAIGLYAVVAFAVSQRSAEIAVRLAVGARPGQVVRHTMRDGIRLTGIALAAGLPISLAGLSLLIITPKMLPAVPLWQVAVFALLCVGGIATAATWLPARRAARVAPATVLRSE
ncbi:MAG TPA: FtsX-like permease family protein, partial [Candidatus Saccharimonadia bacterium]|nr:FtsX-like permease family protein [Candidatus Saccharimonadia bacterium]